MNKTGIIVEAKTKAKDANIINNASGGKTTLFETRDAEVELKEAAFPYTIMSPATAPSKTANVTTARFSVSSITDNCLNERPRTLIIDASRCLSFKLTNVTRAVPTDAAKIANATPKR